MKKKVGAGALGIHLEAKEALALKGLETTDLHSAVYRERKTKIKNIKEM